MLSSPYYFSTIRHITAAFASLFSNIRLQRLNADNSVRQTIRVPIAYGPKRAWYTRVKGLLDSDYTQGHSVGIILPRMSFRMTGLNYDSSRAISPTNTFRAKDRTLTQLLSNYQGSPWDIGYQLTIMVKNTDDVLRIVEQILPAFKPQVTLTITEIPALGLERDVPIILEGVNIDDEFESAYTERQTLMWDFQFTAKTWIYPPISDASVIKKVNAYINSNPDMTNRIEDIQVYVDPLSANEWDVDSNGNPTYSIRENIIIDSNQGV